MKNHHNSNENVAKDEENRESLKKQDVNLKNNSSLYFQIGLILCLLASFGLFEMEFEKTLPDFEFRTPFEEPSVTFTIEPHTQAEEPVKKRQPERRLAILTDKAPIIEKNDAMTTIPEIVMPEQIQPEQTSIISPSTEVPFRETPKEWSMIDVEKVPIFPGCESSKNNAERMACMSEQLTKLIQKRFNTDLAQKLGLSGIQRIQVQFKIDHTGRVTDIKARSPYSELEKEAQRVVSRIPIMTPGMQRNTAVSVVYYLPIAFKVH